MLYGGSALVEAGAQLSGQADVLGLESNERTSAAVVLTVFRRLRRYLVVYGCTIGVDGIVEKVSGWPISLSSYCGGSSSSVSSSTSQRGLTRKYDTIDQDGKCQGLYKALQLRGFIGSGVAQVPCLEQNNA